MSFRGDSALTSLEHAFEFTLTLALTLTPNPKRAATQPQKREPARKRTKERKKGRGEIGADGSRIWPLFDITTANAIKCTAYTRGVGWGVVYCAFVVQ